MIDYAKASTPSAIVPDRRATDVDSRKTAITRDRYDRYAPFYDVMQRLNERRFAPFRAALWSRVQGPRVLEAGVGTGFNILLYPPDLRVTAIDLSPRMVERAHKRLSLTTTPVELLEADVQDLPFPDAHFDTVVATFLFCSVPDPVLGLRELRRVLVPGGQLLLLEHVLSSRPILRRLMRLMNPIVVRMMGANIDRETVENVRRAGLVDPEVKDLGPLDIVKSIDARAPEAGLQLM